MLLLLLLLLLGLLRVRVEVLKMVMHDALLLKLLP
jgi:hypothetical protein